MKIYLLLPCLLMAACQPECRNTNAVFDRYRPEDAPYKKEIVARVRSLGKDGARYKFAGYRKIGTGEGILADVQGDSLCAQAEILVENWAGIEVLKGAAPKGYHGAELAGLEVDIVGDSVLRYKRMDRIVD